MWSGLCIIFVNLPKCKVMLASKKLSSIAIGLFVMLMSCQPVNNLQNSDRTDVNAEIFSNEKSDPGNTSPVYLNDIPVRVVRSFIKEFSENVSVSWQKTNSGLWVATVAADSVEQRIDFNRSGSWNHLWSQYTKFPQDVCARATKSFPDYFICSVSGLILPQDRANTIYSVVIEKANNCKVLKVYKNQLEVISDFIKDTEDGK
jgi:hypothetical protein